MRLSSSFRKNWFCVLMGSFLIFYIIIPIAGLYLRVEPHLMIKTLKDMEVLSVMWRSIWTAAMATFIIFLFGTPLAYFLARNDFRGKSLLEAIIDVPIMVPHTVAGIAMLMIFSPKAFLGSKIIKLGFEPINSSFGVVIACVFVSIPFYVDSAKDAFSSVSPRIEKVSRLLGASMTYTFFNVSMPLARRGIFSGLIMSWARAVSEFGAIIIIAYHPMVAPTLIYDRFATFGLKYSTPIAVELITLCLFMFILLRLLASGKKLSFNVEEKNDLS